MARRISDDELLTYLEATGKPELVAWLLERCQDDEKLRASLLDLVTPKAHTDVLAGEIRGRIRQAWQLAKRRDGWKMALPISRELDQVLVSIRSLMDKGDLANAQKLLVSFVFAAEKSMASNSLKSLRLRPDEFAHPTPCLLFYLLKPLWFMNSQMRPIQV